MRRKRIDDELPRVRANAKDNAEVARFNEAVRVVNAGKHAQAREILGPLAREARDDELSGRAAEVLSSISKPTPKAKSALAPAKKP